MLGLMTALIKPQNLLPLQHQITMVDYNLQIPWFLVLIGYLAVLCDNKNKGRDLNTHINYILLHTLFCKYNLGNMFL